MWHFPTLRSECAAASGRQCEAQRHGRHQRCRRHPHRVDYAHRHQRRRQGCHSDIQRHQGVLCRVLWYIVRDILHVTPRSLVLTGLGGAGA